MKEREGEHTSAWSCLLGLKETLRDLRPGKEESHPRGADSRRVGSRAGMLPGRGRWTGRRRQTGVRTGTEGVAPAAENTQGEDESRHLPGDSEGAL